MAFDEVTFDKVIISHHNDGGTFGKSSFEHQHQARIPSEEQLWIEMSFKAFNHFAKILLFIHLQKAFK